MLIGVNIVGNTDLGWVGSNYFSCIRYVFLLYVWSVCELKIPYILIQSLIFFAMTLMNVALVSMLVKGLYPTSSNTKNPYFIMHLEARKMKSCLNSFSHWELSLLRIRKTCMHFILILQEICLLDVNCIFSNVKKRTSTFNSKLEHAFS